ncbi:patatin-like phospholipase family protein [candidate division KSB1 bacterium]|nr:patatin-like phospholipase family protein [candidate division KSB1 bacterium]
MKIQFGKKPIVLALGGGGARGLAHIGVLKIIERENVPIRGIIGTSMGAIIGAMYAQTPDSAKIEEKIFALLESPAFKSSGLQMASKRKFSETWLDQLAKNIRESVAVNIAAHKRSLFSLERLSEPLAVLLEDKKIEEAAIPFAAVASDLIRGTEVILQRGSIRDAVAASSALPGFIPPIEYNGYFLIDGAATSVVPVREARRIWPKNRVVAVDVSQPIASDLDMENIIEVVLRAYKITARRYHDDLVAEADVLLQPPVGHVHWSDFKQANTLIRLGECSAQDRLNEIRQTASRYLFFS